jgi:UDP-3-O-[3-hydroxymyristoyl] glucosamine N-acyltransferase
MTVSREGQFQGYVSSRAVISPRALIAESVRIYGPVVIEDYVFLDSGVVVGYPSGDEQNILKNKMLTDTPVRKVSFDHVVDASVDATTRIGAQSFIRSGTVIYSGSVLEESVDIAHNVHIREDCYLGRGTRVITGAQIMATVKIGRGCRIAGTLCNRCEVGDCTSMLGHLTHRYRVGVSGFVEASPRIGDGVVVGRESAIVGGIDIGNYAIVAAGSVVTHPVPSGTIWARNPAMQIGIRSQQEIDDLTQRVAGVRGRDPGIVM